MRLALDANELKVSGKSTLRALTVLIIDVVGTEMYDFALRINTVSQMTFSQAKHLPSHGGLDCALRLNRLACFSTLFTLLFLCFITLFTHLPVITNAFR